MFTVSSGVALVLDNNITLQGRSNNNRTLVSVNSSGTLTMNSGSSIIGNTNSGGGGGVNVSGIFIMNGGTFTNNRAIILGGGVYISSAVLIKLAEPLQVMPAIRLTAM